jgi:hypothetical protein
MIYENLDRDSKRPIAEVAVLWPNDSNAAVPVIVDDVSMAFEWPVLEWICQIPLYLPLPAFIEFG